MSFQASVVKNCQWNWSRCTRISPRGIRRFGNNVLPSWTRSGPEVRTCDFDPLTAPIRTFPFAWLWLRGIKQRTCESLNETITFIWLSWLLLSVHVMGHSRLTRIPSDPEAVWIESVIVHPALRGQKVGKYLMLVTEKYCKDVHHFKTAYLCTVDQQVTFLCTLIRIDGPPSW